VFRVRSTMEGESVKFYSGFVPGRITRILGAIAVAGLLGGAHLGPCTTHGADFYGAIAGGLGRASDSGGAGGVAQGTAGSSAAGERMFHCGFPRKDLAPGTLCPVNASQDLSSTAWRHEPDRYCWRNRPDFSATVTGQISTAEGSFDSVTGVTSSNVYSLQLNTESFQTSACAGSPGELREDVWDGSSSSTSLPEVASYNIGCSPMDRQHIVPGANTPKLPGQYVLSDGWCPFQFTTTGPVYCVINAVNQPTVSAHPMTALAQLKVAGSPPGSGVKDAITVTESGVPKGANGDSRLPDLGSKWNEAEFNVFGGGSASQAVFNSGATLQVRTEVLSGTSKGPGCHLKSWTGESNNLTLVNAPPLSPAPLPAPALVFSESVPARPPSGRLLGRSEPRRYPSDDVRRLLLRFPGDRRLPAGGNQPRVPCPDAAGFRGADVAERGREQGGRGASRQEPCRYLSSGTGFRGRQVGDDH